MTRFQLRFRIFLIIFAIYLYKGFPHALLYEILSRWMAGLFPFTSPSDCATSIKCIKIRDKASILNTWNYMLARTGSILNPLRLIDVHVYWREQIGTKLNSNLRSHEWKLTSSTEYGCNMLRALAFQLFAAYWSKDKNTIPDLENVINGPILNWSGKCYLFWKIIVNISQFTMFAGVPRRSDSRTLYLVSSSWGSRDRSRTGTLSTWSVVQTKHTW